jgi:hypothetical protein
MTWQKWLLVAFFVFQASAKIANTGKARPILEPSIAGWLVPVYGLLIWAVYGLLIWAVISA